VVEFSVAGAVATVPVEFEAVLGTVVGVTFAAAERGAATFEAATPEWVVVPAFIPESTEIVFATRSLRFCFEKP
jgi:hypothetical protein